MVVVVLWVCVVVVVGAECCIVQMSKMYKLNNSNVHNYEETS